MTLSTDQRIILFIESGGPGGAERVVLNLAAELMRRGIPVKVLTIRTGWLTEQLKLAGIPHAQIHSRKGLDLLLPIRIAVAARKFGATTIHSHLLDSNFYCAVAAKLVGVGHVATEHGDVHHSDKRRFVALKLQLISRLGSKLIAVSAFSANACAEVAGITPPAVVPNPIAEPITITPSARSLLRTQYGISENDFLWINVANLRPVKDQVTLLRAFVLLIQNTSNQKLLILGEGEERAKLEGLISELNLGGCVQLRGTVQNVANYLAVADGCVLSSLSEALPMSLLEAMSYGVPIVATAVGGIPEIIEDHINGLLAQPSNRDQLAERLEQFATNSSLKSQIGRCGQEKARNFYSAAIATRYLNIYGGS